MLHLRRRKRTAQDIGRVVLCAQSRHRVAENATCEGAYAQGGFMVALSLELLKSNEKFVCRDPRNRPVPDCRIQKIPEPPGLLEGRWCFALSLHLLDELVCDDPEGRASREFRFNLGLQANG